MSTTPWLLFSHSTWRFHERLDVGGHTFLVLENDDAAADHRSLDYWLYDVACGATIAIAKIKSIWGFEAKGSSTGSLAGLVQAKGEAGAPWKKLEADGLPLRWSEASCRFEPDDPPDE